MSTEEPEKRLVGGLEYVKAAQTKGMGYFFGAIIEVVGIGILLLALISLWFRGDADLSGIFWRLAWGCVGVVTIRFGHFMFNTALEIAPVALLTKSSAKRLPEVETLVRGSERPPAADQAELLRAAQHNETPAEELLRPSQKKRQE